MWNGITGGLRGRTDVLATVHLGRVNFIGPYALALPDNHQARPPICWLPLSALVWYPSSKHRREMKKAELVNQIITSLTESLGVLEKAARASHEEATHESSKAESKYDTRGLEAAYLAGGQARQAREILDSIKVYEALVPSDFTPGEPVELTALVELDADGTHSTYFIGPKSGGLEIKHRRKEIMVITPQSPLGQNLIGRKAGQRWVAKLGGSTVNYHIVSVS
jgi:transcription elongation GreA/GreB family factor